MTRKNLIISLIVVVGTLTGLFVFNKLTTRKDEKSLFVRVSKGDFEISISTAGELLAENSVDILAPEVARGRDFHAAELKITDLVPEGTLVNEGDYIATLDRTQFDNTLKDERDRLLTFTTNFETQKLDTAVLLTGLRDGIKNQEHTVTEAELTLANSKYEPPTTIRQAEINVDKQRRTLEQLKRSYALRRAQSVKNLANTKVNLDRVQRRVTDLENLLTAFVIKSPTSGMVMYKKDHHGTKIKTGSNVNPFERVVATVPDLSSLMSRIYISEVDISKVRKGQEVVINIDAFPDRKYTGKVASVANIGEKLPNTDTKVFEVFVRLDGTDPVLRPSMTTANKIVIKTLKDVVFVPNECIYAGTDGNPYVFTRRKKRQLIVTGEANDKSIVVNKGLKPGEMVYLMKPEDADKFRVVGTDPS
jgi:HlyD family secretion protein